MTDAPERILARVDYDGDVDGQWIDADAPKPHSFGHYFTEFVRADMAEARIAELEAALAQCRSLLIAWENAKYLTWDDGMYAFDEGVQSLRAEISFILTKKPEAEAPGQ